MGAAYGAAAEKLPVNKVMGLPFGAAVWLGATKSACPPSVFPGRPPSYPVSVHLNALAGHFVYGVTTELVRRGVRALM